MEVKREDILTPANAITLLGLALSVHGATHIGEMSGVVEFGAGRVLDMVDGFVARRTHASRTGEIFDASADKLAVGAGVVEGFHQHASPELILASIALFNVVNTVANVYSERKGSNPKTSGAGKHYMFGYNASFGAAALSHALGGNQALDITAWGTFAATTPLAVKASWDYTKNALEARLPKKAHSNVTPLRPNKSYQQRRR